MLNSELNESYKLDEAAMLNKKIEDLRLADSKGDYTTTSITSLAKARKPVLKRRKEMEPRQPVMWNYFQNGKKSLFPLPKTSISRLDHLHKWKQH